MKVCIQYTATQRFLGEGMSPVETAEEALKFATSIDAFRHCVEAGLSEVCILVDRGQARPVIVIPVEKSRLSSQRATGFPRWGSDVPHFVH